MLHKPGGSSITHVRASRKGSNPWFDFERRIRTHLLAFDVYLRKRKLLLALAAVKGAHAAAPAAGDPDAHLITVRFAQEVRRSAASEAEQV